jgi:acetyl esterase/lipase
MRPRYIKLALFVPILLLAPSLLPADEKSDLKRTTPVPSNEQVPLIDFFRPAILQEPILSPAGTHVAAIITASSDRHMLLVYDLKTQKQEIVGGPVGDSDISQVRWLNDRRLVFQVSIQKLYGVGLFAADVGSLSECYPLLQYYGSRVISVPTNNRLRPLVWNSHDNLQTHRDLGVASVDTDLRSTGKAVSVLAIQTGTLQGLSAVKDAQENNERHIEDRYPMPGPGIVSGYMADKDGRLEYAFVGQDRSRSLFRLVSGKWTKCPVDLEKVAIIDCGNEPGQLVAVGGEMDGRPRPLRFLDSSTGNLGNVLLPEKYYDFTGSVYRDPISHVVLGASSQRDRPHMAWFNDLYENLQKVLDGFFPGVYVRILGSNEAQNLFLVATYSDRQPPVYSWVDLEKRTAGLIEKSMPWIDPNRMQPEQVFKFKTRDGHILDSYLTLPAGASKTNPSPLVVLSHGGPWLRDNWGYNGETQFLASRGYAVLQTNYRGSPGYGWKFPAGEDWDFQKMHYDVADATRAAIASGLVDAKRVAIMGGSFGGYLALEGVVDDPELYCCAVTIAGVFDWEQFLDEKKFNFEHFGDSSFSVMMLREGDPNTQKEKFDAIAPVRHINRVRVPVFVSAGGYDEIADIGQSKRLLSELEKNNVPHESFIVSTETHGMQHLSNEVALYSRIEAFLARNIAPSPPAAAAGGAP